MKKEIQELQNWSVWRGLRRRLCGEEFELVSFDAIGRFSLRSGAASRLLNACNS
jgi:hypothetical protein